MNVKDLAQGYLESFQGMVIISEALFLKKKEKSLQNRSC